MKYLKRFNEELKPYTYVSAARKLTKMNQPERAKELKDWAHKRVLDDNIIEMEKIRQEYDRFGVFKMKMTNKKTGKSVTGDFNLYISFDPDGFSDNYLSMKEDGSELESIFITFFIGLIPTSKELMAECHATLADPDQGNGFYWGLIFAPSFDIVDDQVVIKSIHIDNYDDSLSGDVTFVDRPSAGRFRTLMKNIVTDPNLGYPSGRNDVKEIWEGMEKTILVECELSSDYGFKLEDIGTAINKLNPNDIMTQKGEIKI